MSNQLQVSGEAKIRAIQGPVVANSGVITALDGDASEYVRGDGTLADFPTSTGGGSSVSYYLNTSVSQGTIGGVAYKQLSKVPISGAGTDVTTSANGYIASYITDANDPALLEVPAGNFNCEFYFSVNSNAHNPYVYAEVYKYDGTTFTLLGSNVSIPQYLSNGTTLSPYYFAIAVSTAVLTVTDRIAIRIYVNVDGRTVTLHTENNHLCQVVTTFSKGLISLNNLTRQNQFFATGTSGTDFAISSATATHTFNLPVASATNTGKLSSTDWSTFNGKVPYTGATANVDLGTNSLFAYDLFANGNGTNNANLYLKQGTASLLIQNGYSNILATGTKIGFQVATSAIAAYYADLQFSSLTAQRTFTLPDITGTLALLEGTQTFTGVKTFDEGISLKSAAFPTPATGYSSIGGNSFGITIITKQSSTIYTSNLGFPAANRTFTFPNADGTIALLESTQTFSGVNTFSSASRNESGILLKNGTMSALAGYTGIGGGSLNNGIDIILNGGAFTQSLLFQTAAGYSYTFPAATGTIALTSNLSSYVPYTGATGAVNLGAFDLTVNSVKVGRGNGSISTNSVLGETALNSNTTGSTNTAIGYGALQLNTTGLSNTAIGHAALNYNTTSSWNTAVGVSALGLSTGGQNTAIGYAALSNNTTGVFNIAIGYTTGTSIVTGNYNTIIGNYAGTAAMSNNIVLADGAGTIRYQWNGTNNAFTGAATFSSDLSVINTSNALLKVYSNTTSSPIADIELMRGTNTTWGADAYTDYRIRSSGGDLLIQSGESTVTSTRLTITSAGNVGIGTSSPLSLLHIADADTDQGIRLTRANGTFGFRYCRSGAIQGMLSDGTTFQTAIQLNEGNASGSQHLVLQPTAGNVLIGATTKVGGAGTNLEVTGSRAQLVVNSTGSIASWFTVYPAGDGNTYILRNTGYSYRFGTATSQDTSGFVEQMSISSNGSVGAPNGTNIYNASDIRLKQNITKITEGLSKINALNPVKFNWVDDFEPTENGKELLGFIAQEVKDIIPEAVESFGTNSVVIGDTIIENPLRVNEKFIIPILVNAIQEQQAIITSLQDRLDKLENK